MMSVLDRLLALVEKAIRIISLRSILIWALAALLSIVGLTVFEYRNNILSVLFDNDAPIHRAVMYKPSPSIIKRLEYFVDREDVVIGIVLLSVDIRNNTRMPVFWYSDDAIIQRGLNLGFESRYSGIPLFTSNDRNNAMVVSSINAEFKCGTFNETGTEIVLPGLGNKVAYICNSSVPPFFGHFSGYMSVLLDRTPTEHDMDVMKAEVINMSNEIYLREIQPHIR